MTFTTANHKTNTKSTRRRSTVSMFPQQSHKVTSSTATSSSMSLKTTITIMTLFLISSSYTTNAFTTKSSTITTSYQRNLNTISSINQHVVPNTHNSNIHYNNIYNNNKYYNQRRNHSKKITLHMMSPAATTSTVVATKGAAALMGVISGGILGGALHAIAGPDHLAALLPRCCGQRWFRAGRIGALWGMGHGVSATILGLTAFGLKNRISNIPGINSLLHGASSMMEIAVGASLILIGILGMKEAREWEEELETSMPIQSLSAAAADAGVKTAQKRAVVFNGILHGFSWDGAPSLAPALAVATWKGSISFLLAYAVGTMGAMTLATTLIGESTRRAGEIFHRPDIPQKLSFISSVLAMAVGVFWCYLAFK